jgi:hypothetical protein
MTLSGVTSIQGTKLVTKYVKAPERHQEAERIFSQIRDSIGDRAQADTAVSGSFLVSLFPRLRQREMKKMSVEQMNAVYEADRNLFVRVLRQHHSPLTRQQQTYWNNVVEGRAPMIITV